MLARWQGALLAGALALGALCARPARAGVAVMLVDTDRVTGSIDERLYGHFLEHINHSVVDGLYAEQVRGQGFEGSDFEQFWEPLGEAGAVTLAPVSFQQGEHSVHLAPQGKTAGLRQGRVSILAGQSYDGSLWLRPQGEVSVSVRVVGAGGGQIARRVVHPQGEGWSEVPFTSSFPQSRIGPVQRFEAPPLLAFPPPLFNNLSGR